MNIFKIIWQELKDFWDWREVFWDEYDKNMMDLTNDLTEEQKLYFWTIYRRI